MCSLRMVFSQFWKCFVTFEQNPIKKNTDAFLSFWDPELEKKNKLPKYKNRIELELLNDDLDLQVPTLQKTWEFIFLEKQWNIWIPSSLSFNLI